MSETIPDDIVAAVDRLYEEWGRPDPYPIQLALLAERKAQIERNAEIAEHLNGWGSRDGTAEHIAKVIRAQLK